MWLAVGSLSEDTNNLGTLSGRLKTVKVVRAAEERAIMLTAHEKLSALI